LGEPAPPSRTSTSPFDGFTVTLSSPENTTPVPPGSCVTYSSPPPAIGLNTSTTFFAKSVTYTSPAAQSLRLEGLSSIAIDARAPHSKQPKPPPGASAPCHTLCSSPVEPKAPTTPLGDPSGNSSPPTYT